MEVSLLREEKMIGLDCAPFGLGVSLLQLERWNEPVDGPGTTADELETSDEDGECRFAALYIGGR